MQFETTVPAVLDRFIQQALLQVLQPRFDPTFSEYSYGFRPGRSAQQAIATAQRYVDEGRRYVVDVDLEKFFNTSEAVNALLRSVIAALPERTRSTRAKPRKKAG